jgi:hypothetical protein
MISRTELPSISSVLSRLDIPPGRHGRTRCPVHQGDNQQVFSYDDDRGQWFCFRCGIGGDAIELVKKALDLDFRGALKWLGIDQGKPSVSNPQMALVTFSVQGRFAQQLDYERRLRDEFRTRSLIESQGIQRLRSDPDSSIGWKLLEVAYSGPGLDAIENELDELLELIPREAYPRRVA